MAKRKKANAQPWDAVFDRVRASRAPEDVWPSVPETELDAAEAALGLPLPASYRAFAMRFSMGGELWGLFRLNDLFAERKKEQDYTVINWTRWMQDNIVDDYGAHMSLPQEQLREFVFFGDDCGGGNFAWDTGNPTSTNPVEYPVYWYPRSDEQIDSWGNSFAEFVQRVHTEAREFDDWQAAYIHWRPHRVRKKKAPLKRDVKLWLAFNNNTARDLALSIRDRGQTDAFPILADALQEAGCTNADLLDSCRHGDPDIDGVWVLRVLLGES
jgi:hypothetical protein